jgi:hypothetical protein
MKTAHFKIYVNRLLIISLFAFISACNSTPTKTSKSNLKYLAPVSGEAFSSDFRVQQVASEIEVYEGDNGLFIAFMISRYGTASPFLFSIKDGKRISLKSKYPKEQKEELKTYIQNPNSLGHLKEGPSQNKQRDQIHVFSQKNGQELFVKLKGGSKGTSQKVFIETVNFSKEIPLVRKAVEQNNPSLLTKTYSGAIEKFIEPEIAQNLKQIQSLEALETSKKVFAHLTPRSGHLQCRLMQIETQLKLQQQFKKATTVQELASIKKTLNSPIPKCYVVKRNTVYKTSRYERNRRKYFAVKTRETLPKGDIIKAESDKVEILRGKKTQNNWIATEGNNQLGQKLTYSSLRLPEEFQLVDPWDVKPLKPYWPKSQHLALESQIKNYKNRDFKLADQQSFDHAVRKNSVASYQAYLDNNPKGRFQDKAIKGLIESYRRLNTPEGFIKAFKLSKDDQDFKSAFARSQTDEQKAFVLKAYPLKHASQIPMFFELLQKCASCDKSDFYKKAQSLAGFGHGLTADNIEHSYEYKYVLKHLTPKFYAIKDGQNYGFRANYDGYTLTAFQPGNCRYSHEEREEGWQGIIFARRVERFYKIYACQSSPASNQKLLAQSKAMGQMAPSVLNQTWKYSKLVATFRIYNDNSTQNNPFSNRFSADIKNLCLGASGKSHWQMCYNIKDSDFKNVCVGMTEFPDSCYGVKDPDLKNFCLGASGQYRDFCYSIKNSDLKEACLGISKNSSHCYGVKDNNLKSMCLGISNNRNNCYNIR